MVKSLIVTLNSLVLLFLGLFAGESISLQMETRNEVEAGTQFDVSVMIDKGDSESFARFSAELPRGLKAVSGSAENADFRFEGQQVKFVWMRLPNLPKLRLSYRVEVDPRLRGTFTLGGELAYIADNARQTAVVAPRTIVITPSPNVVADKQLDLADYQTSIPAQRDIALAMLKVRCIRETPTLLSDGQDYVVRILVNRGEALKFAKIEENIPKGYTAEPIDAKEAIFSCEDGVVKFLWMTLPAEELFTVSYRLIPEKGAGLKGDPKITGSFSFVQNEATRTIAIPQRAVRLQNMTTAQLEGLVRETPVVRSELSNSEGGTLDPQGPSQGGVEFEVKHQKIAPMSQGKGARAGRRTRIVQNMDDFLLAPESGVYYRVQVAAGHRPIDINRYFRRLSLHADVRTERHEGWYKYSVGSFKEYKEARDYRTEVWNTTPIRDAFVAAYNNGNRITVQEALMITSQKWYR